MDFWARLETIRDRWDLLSHPLYRWWTRGELRRAELAAYAAQYRHAVAGEAAACAAAARVAPDVAVWDELETHACERRRHIMLFNGFAMAVGGDPTEAPTPHTRDCVSVWAPARDRSLVRTLVGLYVIDAAAAPVAAAQCEALRHSYGIDDPSATAYFGLQAQRASDHAEQWRALVDWARREQDDEAMLGEAERVARARWAFLDAFVVGMERVAA